MKTIAILFVALLTLPTSLNATEDILTTAASNGSFKTLTSLVIAADLDETLQGKGHFTVFAPTDDAFEMLPEETLQALLESKNKQKLADILKYHVLPTTVSVPKRNSHPLKSAKTLQGKRVRFDRNGTKVKVNNARIVTRNIRCSNGLIHVIDAVLVPPTEEDRSIVGVAAKAGQFNTLLAAAKAAGLVETLSGKGPLTVFAPTDDAFAALPEGTIESLLEPENRDKLADILKYHVIAGKVTAADAVKAGTAKTVLGQSVTATIKQGRLTINQATVIDSDLKTSNGLIHVIDKVLIPTLEHH